MAKYIQAVGAKVKFLLLSITFHYTLLLQTAFGSQMILNDPQSPSFEAVGISMNYTDNILFEAKKMTGDYAEGIHVVVKGNTLASKRKRQGKSRLGKARKIEELTYLKAFAYAERSEFDKEEKAINIITPLSLEILTDSARHKINAETAKIKKETIKLHLPSIMIRNISIKSDIAELDLKNNQLICNKNLHMSFPDDIITKK